MIWVVMFALSICAIITYVIVSNPNDKDFDLTKLNASHAAKCTDEAPYLKGNHGRADFYFSKRIFNGNSGVMNCGCKNNERGILTEMNQQILEDVRQITFHPTAWAFIGIRTDGRNQWRWANGGAELTDAERNYFTTNPSTPIEKGQCIIVRKSDTADGKLQAQSRCCGNGCVSNQPFKHKDANKYQHYICKH